MSDIRKYMNNSIKWLNGMLNEDDGIAGVGDSPKKVEPINPTSKERPPEDEYDKNQPKPQSDVVELSPEAQKMHDLKQELISREDCTENADGSYSFTGDVDLSQIRDMEQFPIKFDKVGGNFDCFYSLYLESFVGGPTYVGGNFNCGYDNSDADVKNSSNIESLEGCPTYVGGNFDCSNMTRLKSLEGAPNKVGGDFICSHCHELDDLIGSPQHVGGDFSCGRNYITNFKGAPNKVDGNFYCSHNYVDINDISDIPKVIGGDFVMYGQDREYDKRKIRAVSNIDGYVKL